MKNLITIIALLFICSSCGDMCNRPTISSTNYKSPITAKAIYFQEYCWIVVWEDASGKRGSAHTKIPMASKYSYLSGATNNNIIIVGDELELYWNESGVNATRKLPLEQ